jgi:hypothetical protein
MSEAKLPTGWNWETYLEWEVRQPIRYELVDGQVYALAGGGRTRHHRQQFTRRASCSDARQAMPVARPRP